VNHSTPLSRRQLANIQITRGVPADEIQQRTGMPRASYDALFNPSAAEQEKEVTKLISKTTFDRLIGQLGIESDFCGLRPSGVLEWRANGTPRRTAPQWTEAAAALIKELLSDKLTLAEIVQRGKKRFLSRLSESDRMLLIYDRQRGIRIAVTRAPGDLLMQLEKMTGITCQRRVTLGQQEFKNTREMIRHEVLRSVQFDSLTGVIVPTYTWTDVQAAAREFGFHTDDLVNMMHGTAERRSIKRDQTEQQHLNVDGFGATNETDDAANRENTDFQVRHLRVISG
jgi:hypothetical protein